MKRGPGCYDPLCEKHNPKSMNYCNCPNCRTDNCPNAESPAEIAENANDTFVMGDIIRLRKVEAAQKEELHMLRRNNMNIRVYVATQGEEIEKLRAALERLRDCDWVITPHDRMDAVRDIARDALTKPQSPQT